MIIIIKNGEVYAPEYIGKMDVVIAGGKIEAIAKSVSVPQDFAKVRVIDAEGKLVFPGFIDAHVHITGGGGEGGFKTRTPEIQLSDIIAGGITTVVGCLGTDGVCRDMKGLLAKARALDEEGISTYIYSGSYQIPVNTITNSCRSDIMLIDKIIGVGEIAISDHRSSQPTYEDFIKVVAEARVGGLLSGKAGIVNVHLGYGERRLQYLVKMVKETEIPIKQVIPTHINRNINLFDAGIEFAKLGGIIDMTTSSDPDHLEEDEVKASRGLKMALERGIPVEQIQFTSDGQGSMPIFNKKRELIGLGIGSTKSLYIEVRDAVLKDGVDLEVALKVITSNVATNLKLYNKGFVQEGRDADLVLVNKNDLNIETVFAKGVEVVSKGQVLVKGTFEK
ncbi:beta-aspartyl-peptidase [Clostridium estertheticum]|uniref:Isoaspartyl dipeptidase n=1 Tax=Clostridium estertheticum TaxID=238834 RepID=A0AA47I8Y0_9CLOT|nr:beta-aspartyl-peptidase [Clostridium estertheticum]MBU3157655.1 beta-aspartyl-peptidase [Clostridium estertheticum]MBU3178396.1 beta-aspartyl-peptidase [Clostridium estertheticum]MBU3200933.1 beta-aspartyl-peptidase [Clostridium estertheticum]WAG62555.1 beta-aspartyl-peptidase [Clostridium estertheticum]WAG67938.1 beta-aspartyl-peptidase [Clostridium estertheticum]